MIRKKFLSNAENVLSIVNALEFMMLKLLNQKWESVKQSKGNYHHVDSVLEVGLKMKK